MTKPLEQAISDRRRVLGNQYAYLDEVEEIAELRDARRILENPHALEDELASFRRPVSRFDGIAVDSPQGNERSENRKARLDVQRFVRDIHKQMWAKRAELFSDYASRRPIDMLNPRLALEMLGYEVASVGALGTIADAGGSASNVAGLIDMGARQVLIATGLSPAVRNFTLAHELGHAVMHELSGMHRDKPLDGSANSRDRLEREADSFATHFLMPEKLVRQSFEEIFGEAPFVLDEARRFALSGSLPSERWQPRSVRELCRVLSSAERYNRLTFVSLMKRFGVSKEAMAIRLEELDLISLDRG